MHMGFRPSYSSSSLSSSVAQSFLFNFKHFFSSPHNHCKASPTFFQGSRFSHVFPQGSHLISSRQTTLNAGRSTRQAKVADRTGPPIFWGPQITEYVGVIRRRRKQQENNRPAHTDRCRFPACSLHSFAFWLFPRLRARLALVPAVADPLRNERLITEQGAAAFCRPVPFHLPGRRPFRNKFCISSFPSLPQIQHTRPDQSDSIF